MFRLKLGQLAGQNLLRPRREASIRDHAQRRAAGLFSLFQPAVGRPFFSLYLPSFLPLTQARGDGAVDVRPRFHLKPRDQRGAVSSTAFQNSRFPLCVVVRASSSSDALSCAVASGCCSGVS